MKSVAKTKRNEPSSAKTRMGRGIKLGLLVVTVTGIGVPVVLATTTVNKTKLTVGDGKISTQAKRDYLWSCRANNFVAEGQAGAQVKGPWFNGDGTWDKTKKVSVLGSVAWTSAAITFKVSGDSRIISGNGLPTTHKTGTYPIVATDPAYAYDRNPSKIAANLISLTLPVSPKTNSTAQCASGEVGVALSGVMINDALDAGGRDAVANEVQDLCDGHPQESGVYHYHSGSRCSKATEQFGWALDGFPIMGSADPKDGHEITNAELDDCHGRTSEITIGGKKVTTYHYVANDEFPYTVGCFRGTATRVAKTGQTTQSQPTGPLGETGQSNLSGRTPPPRAPGNSGSFPPLPPRGPAPKR